MKKITAGILSAAAVVTSLVLVRQQRAPDIEQTERPKQIPAGETVPADVTPDRLRELGL